MTEGASNKSKRHRSRNYPASDLEVAIERVRALHSEDGFNWTPVSVACNHWNLKSTSSSGIRALAALLQYGLLDEEGKGKDRRVRLSELAKRILRPHPSPERVKAMQEAALKPSIFNELWEKHGSNLPSDKTLRWELTESGDLNERYVDNFIETYKNTIRVAELMLDSILGEVARDTQADSDGEMATETASGAMSSSSSSGAKKPMPITGAPDRRDFDLPIQLSAGLQGTLRLPIPMTPADWKKVEEALEKVEGLKTFLVSEDEGSPDDNPAPGS